jgi:peptidoglycan hydrolase-like amidase
LPSEWIASWGSTGPGNSGTNSLLAGAVAIRTYAIGFVNNPASANYDICGTTTCQA